ncbi:hypothetical protein [Williamsia sp.]|uniref:hypothetical protein n=1 Tax=Williamsia sp. TaxID=1872085 RepID=UPI001A21903F|nr:hypothetical protein [Williamsia sp.]MBJ7289399.1 hypothetical protein [Williamsia sp.]
MTDQFSFSLVHTSGHPFALSKLTYDLEAPDSVPLVTTGAPRYASKLEAMAAAENASPPERATKWTPALTQQIPELRDEWVFGTTMSADYAALVCVHPAAADFDLVNAAWTLVVRRVLAPQQRPQTRLSDILTGPERYELLRYAPAPRLITRQQADHANRIRAKGGRAPISLTRLNALVTTKWHRARAQAQQAHTS